jgi:hypothetical protein
MLPIFRYLPKNVCLGSRSGQCKVWRAAFSTLREVPLLKGPNTVMPPGGLLFLVSSERALLRLATAHSILG